jgi:hypothetical protein
VIKGRIIIEKQQSIKKLVLYNKLTKKEEELFNSLLKQYNAYVYVLNNNIYIVEQKSSKFSKNVQRKLINEFGYKQNANYYQKRI